MMEEISVNLTAEEKTDVSTSGSTLLAADRTSLDLGNEGKETIDSLVNDMNDDVVQNKESEFQISQSSDAHLEEQFALRSNSKSSLHESENSVRVRLPSHTVPFTQQSSRAPFETFMETLLAMGYEYNQSAIALTYVNGRSVEEAIDFLTMKPGEIHVDPHPFTPLKVETSKFGNHQLRNSNELGNQILSSQTVSNDRFVNGNINSISKPRSHSYSSEPITLSPHQSSRSLSFSQDKAMISSEKNEHDEKTRTTTTNHGTTEQQFANVIRSEIGDESSNDIQNEQEALVALTKDTENVDVDERMSDINNSGVDWTVCAICGLEEPFHVKMSATEELFTLDNMEMSNDPVVAQQQRKIQFEARMARQHERLLLEESSSAVLEEKEYKNSEKSLKNAQADGATKFCEICLDEKPEDEFYSSSKCGHGFCVECLREHYRVKICDANILDLVCMHFGCNRKIKEVEILSHFEGDTRMLEKYDKFKRNALLARNKNCRWCPKPGCETPMIGNPRKPRLQCPECKTVICFNCNQDWHPGKKCDELIDERYSKWAKGKDIQLCPKCKARVWKNMGCNHMTCPSCHHQFCWLCRGTYRSENHFAPWNFLGCPGRQFSYESGTRPNILMRAIWRFGIFLVVIILGALALGVGAAALGLVIAAVIVCCPCLLVVQCKRMREEHDVNENPRVLRRQSLSSDDDHRVAIGSPIGVPRFERREFESFWSANEQPVIRNVDGVFHIMTDDGNFIDFDAHERDTLIRTVTDMGYVREHVLQAIEEVGCSLEHVLDWCDSHPYDPTLTVGGNGQNATRGGLSSSPQHSIGDDRYEVEVRSG